MQEEQLRSDIVAINGAILHDKRLTPTQKIVYARIAYFKEYFESSEAAAEFLGLTTFAVQKAKRILEQLGYIRCIENTGRGKRYVSDLEAGLGESQTQSWQNARPCEMQTQTLRNANSDLANRKLRVGESQDIDKNINKNEIRNKNMSAPAKPAPTCVPDKAIELANKLKERILENKPNRKIDKNWLENWSKDIDRLHRIDGRSWEEIEKAIVWSQENSFWRTNILSGAKLREKIDALEDQMARENIPTRGGGVLDASKIGV